MAFRAQRAAAALALRWHAGTGALVALTAALTLAGSLPALALLGGSPRTPALTLALAETPALLADWGTKGVVWTQLQQLAVQRLTGLLSGATALIVLVGALTLLALHLARTAVRSTDITVARSVGASRRTVFSALLLESSALAGVALSAGAGVAALLSGILRATWPGSVASPDVLLTAGGVLGVTAMVMLAPLLMIRAITTARLVDDDRRPLTLIIPALQLGAALVVVAGGLTLRKTAQAYQGRLNDPALSRLKVLDAHAVSRDRLQRAQAFAAFLAREHVRAPERLVSVASSGVHRGFGAIANVTADCTPRCSEGVAVRTRTETAVHHAVSSDTFAVAGLSLLQGRAFTDRDRWDAPLVAVVSVRVAREMFPDGDAVGRRVQIDLLDSRWFEVIGVVDDAVARGLGGAVQPPFAIYVSVLQQPVGLVEVATLDRGVARDAVADFARTTGEAQSMRDRLQQEARVLSWFTRMLTVMGIVAVIIALGGLFAMLTLWLESHRQEIGVRRAVGARRRDVHLLVLSRAAMVALCGSLFGAWLGQIGWDVLPRVVEGATRWDGRVVASSGVALSATVMLVAWSVSARFLRGNVGALLQGEE
jgi:putative ABC transport system permease protein